MKTPIRNGSALRAPEPGTPVAGEASQSPEHNGSATSGTYFRAVRRTPESVDAATRAEQKRRARCVARLRSLVRMGAWAADSTTAACGIVADGWLLAEEPHAALEALEAKPPRSAGGSAR
jgi:hypothetical protein